MKLYVKFSLTVLVLSVTLLGLSWFTYLLNQPDNLLVVGGVLGLIATVFLTITGFKLIWRTKHEHVKAQ